MTAQAPLPLRNERWVPEDTFGFRLRQVRLQLGLTIEEIAGACGYVATTWSNWEKGHRPRDYEKVVTNVVRVTNVNRDWLAWGSDQGIPETGWIALPAGQAA